MREVSEKTNARVAWFSITSFSFWIATFVSKALLLKKKLI